MRFLTRNNVKSTIAEAISTSDTVITINVAQPPFRNPPEPFPNDSAVASEDKEERVRLTLAYRADGDNRIEIIDVLSIDEDPSDSTKLVLNVERAVQEVADDDPAPRNYAFPENSLIYLSNTADAIKDKVNRDETLLKVEEDVGTGFFRVKTLSPNNEEIIVYSYQE